MPFSAAIGAAGAIGSGVLGFLGAGNAAKAQSSAIQAGLNQQKDLFNQGLQTEQPFIDRGNQAGSTLMSLLTPGPNQTAALSQIPGFLFAQDWGQKAVANQGSVTGFGGNTLSAGANYATGLAQQGFGQIASLLSGVYNTGAGAANSVLGNAVQSGANQGQMYGQLGQAQGAGIMGQYNALGGALSGAANSGTNALLLSKLFPNGAGSATPSSAPSGIYSGGAAPAPYTSIPTPWGMGG